jgi:hypothetical protein
MNKYQEFFPLPKSLRGKWASRVEYSRRGGGYAYRPNEIYCLDTKTKKAAETITEFKENASDDKSTRDEVDNRDDVYTNTQESVRVRRDDEREDGEWLHRFGGSDYDGDVQDLIDELRRRGFNAEPNYVLFAHPLDANPVYASPVYASPVYASPVYASPVYASPVYASPVYASPVYASPVYANPVYANAYICDGVRPSTAHPADPPSFELSEYEQDGESDLRVVILDTGISSPKFCPPKLKQLSKDHQHDRELPDDGEDPDHQPDGFLDPASGHGTFIAGIIQSLIPGPTIVPARVVTSFGDVDVAMVVERIEDLLGTLDDHTIVNMSFGGYADAKMDALERAIRRIRRTGAVVVASAGNDGTSRPMFPACFSDVVGVAALDPYSPAPYSNHGSWVRACAPGTDLVSAFFRFDGKMDLRPMPGSSDPDKFEHWARWTGTSFAAPVVAAALLRHMKVTGGDANDAVANVIDAPRLFRVPDLGTVVNLAPPDSGCL